MKNSFKNMSFEELVAKRKEIEKQLMELELKKSITHVDNPLSVRTMRRQVARLHTRERELILKEKKEKEAQSTKK